MSSSISNDPIRHFRDAWENDFKTVDLKAITAEHEPDLIGKSISESTDDGYLSTGTSPTGVESSGTKSDRGSPIHSNGGSSDLSSDEHLTSTPPPELQKPAGSATIEKEWVPVHLDMNSILNPLGPAAQNANAENKLKLLEAAFRQPPRSGDSQRRKYLLPPYKFDIPSSWPSEPPAFMVSNSKFNAGLSDEVLFYMFYFAEGTAAQNMAAQQLRNREWRYHRSHRVWLQRQERPKIINPEFERGAYRYWDPKEWCERIKYDFQVEYRLLDLATRPTWPPLQTDHDLFRPAKFA